MEAYIFSVDMLPESVRSAAADLGNAVTGVRLRPNRPVQLTYSGGDKLCEVLSRSSFDDIVLALMGHSLYARQQELDKGFFMLPDGSRAGICGRYPDKGPRDIGDISSVCIRIARQAYGCANDIMPYILSSRGALVISPPGLGKTTMLRDISRQLSESGKTVCIIDERGEIAACSDGIPRLDVGPRTDVITGLEKHAAVIMAVRACAPETIVTDEIGDVKDARALSEAVRCGVRVIASAHGTGLSGKGLRSDVNEMLAMGLFDTGILLGPGIGEIADICTYSEKGSGAVG